VPCSTQLLTLRNECDRRVQTLERVKSRLDAFVSQHAVLNTASSSRGGAQGLLQLRDGFELTET
jgi:hypothetical protein